MQDHEIIAMAEQVAKATVKQFFLALGVDADDPNEVKAVKKDFAHLRSWREASDTVKRTGLAVAVTTIVAGGLGWIWMKISSH